MKKRRLAVCGFALICGCVELQAEAQQAPKAGAGELAQVEDTKSYAGEPYVIETVRTKGRFEADGKNEREMTVRIRVQSEAAVKQLGLMVYSYMASFEKLEVLYVRVRKPDGSVVETPASAVQELDSEVSREAPMYTDQKEKHIAVKSLAAGDVLELGLRWTMQTPLTPGNFWYSDNFEKHGICLKEEIELNVPREVKAKLASTIEPLVREEGNRRIYTIHSSRLKNEKEDEKNGPAWAKDFYGAKPPDVQLSSFESWSALGDWFGKLVQPRAEVTPAIRAKAEELVSGKKSEREKIEAIYSFVATRFRYIGVDLGMGRYTPHSAEEVLNNRYGDCKDKHTLFAALLQAAEIKAYPALISTVFKVEGGVPAPGIFNHVITAVPQGGDSYLFLDTTPEMAPYGLLMAGLRNRMALVMPTGQEAKLVQTPADWSPGNSEKYKMDAAIQTDGTLDGKGSWEARGDEEVVFRSAFRNTGQNQWTELVQQMVGRLGFAGKVSDIAASQPENTGEAFHFTYAYHREKYSDWANRRITLPFPPIFVAQLTDKEKMSKEPLPLGSPQELVYEATLKLPAGVTPQVPGDVNRNTAFAEYAAKYSYKDGVLKGTRWMKLKAREVPAGERGAWSSFVKAILDDEEKWIFLAGEIGTEADARRGMKLLEEGKAAEAAAVLEKQAQENPDNPWFKLMLGRAYLAMADEAKAMGLFSEMLKENDDAAGMLNGVAYELARANRRVSEAVGYATGAVALTEKETEKIDLESAGTAEYRRMAALAAQWDTLGLAHMRAGHLLEAEKYLRASWLLWQRAVVGEHLVELYEKEGKKKAAAEICEMALAAPGKEEETGTKEKLTLAQERLGVPQETYTVNAKTYHRPASGGIALTDLRMTKIPMPAGNPNADQKNATFAVMFENGNKEVRVKFVSGAAELKELAKSLAGAKYQVEFPDYGQARIIRQGLVSCSKYTKECTFVLFPLESMAGMFEQVKPVGD